jgi:hypothetical protein
MDSLLLFLSLQVTIVILKLVFRSEICHFFPPFFLRLDSFHSASVAISVLALFVSFLAWVAPNAAERGAKERHRHAVKKEEQDWLLKGLDALHRGQNLNFSPWEPFFVAVKKNEAAARARGLAFKSVFDIYPEATEMWRPGAETGEEPREREPEAERGSIRQAPASHRGSPRRRRTLGRDDQPRNNSSPPRLMFDGVGDRLSSETLARLTRSGEGGTERAES